MNTFITSSSQPEVQHLESGILLNWLHFCWCCCLYEFDRSGPSRLSETSDEESKSSSSESDYAPSRRKAKAKPKRPAKRGGSGRAGGGRKKAPARKKKGSSSSEDSSDDNASRPVIRRKVAMGKRWDKHKIDFWKCFQEMEVMVPWCDLWYGRTYLDWISKWTCELTVRV